MYILVNRDSGVRLSEADGGYKQFWKQICLFGEYVNPNGGAHPNCSCVEKFGVEEDGEEIFDYSKLDPKNPEYMYPHEQDFYERAIKEFGNVERVPKADNTPTGDFIINNEEWELKSLILEKLNKFTVRNEIFRATDKGKRNIFIDNYQEKHDIKQIVEMAEKHIAIEKNDKLIDGLVVVSGDSFIKIK